MANNLIIYYSRKGENYVGGTITSLEKGNSERCAEYIRNAVGGDLFEVRPVKSYPSDYMACTEEAKAELKAGARPELAEYLNSIDGYDNVFVCGPCWWGTFPMPVFSLLEPLNFAGKKVMVLMTHEGSGLGGSERDMKKLCRGAKFGKALAIQGGTAARAESTVAAWARSQV